MKPINDLNEAIREVGRFLSIKEDKLLHVIYQNKKRHAFLKTKKNKKYYLIYKKEFFLKFADVFPGEKGLGESINVPALHFAIDHNCSYILIAYKEGNIYYVNPNEWLRYADTNATYRKVEAPEIGNDQGKPIIEKEVTASIPLRILKRFKG